MSKNVNLPHVFNTGLYSNPMLQFSVVFLVHTKWEDTGYIKVITTLRWHDWGDYLCERRIPLNWAGNIHSISIHGISGDQLSAPKRWVMSEPLPVCSPLHFPAFLISWHSACLFFLITAPFVCSSLNSTGGSSSKLEFCASKCNYYNEQDIIIYTKVWKKASTMDQI